MATVERDKHTAVDEGGNSDGRGRDQWMKELAVTSDVDWISSWYLYLCPFPPRSSSSTTVFESLINDMLNVVSTKGYVHTS